LIGAGANVPEVAREEEGGSVRACPPLCLGHWGEMAYTVREFRCEDLFRFNLINLDEMTETYDTRFYMQYLSTWPDFCEAVEHPDGTLMAYMLGKVEGEGDEWHGHVTAVTVAPEFRRLGLAAKLMRNLEARTDEVGGFFVDLFVRCSNKPAIAMYENLGYTVYRRVVGYYGGGEDAFDMRKAMKADVHKKSIAPLARDVQAGEVY